MIASQNNDLLMRDAFLAEQLGRDVRRLDAGVLARLGDHAADAMNEEMEALRQPAFVYAKLRGNAEAEMLSLLHAHGFDVIDTAVTLEASRMSECTDAGATLRAARASDEEAVVELAVRTLTSSRFHRDPGIAPASAANVKAAWVRNYFAGERGDGMIVATREDGAAIDGFLLATSAADGAMVIDLVAVAAHARRRGLCRAMTQTAQQLFPDATTLRVGTQGSNRESLEAYRNIGFEVVGMDLVLHAHVNWRAAPQQGARCA
jgi:ribosomal protein S18 acetylase RimI-like enzyme